MTGKKRRTWELRVAWLSFVIKEESINAESWIWNKECNNEAFLLFMVHWLSRKMYTSTRSTEQWLWSCCELLLLFNSGKQIHCFYKQMCTLQIYVSNESTLSIKSLRKNKHLHSSHPLLHHRHLHPQPHHLNHHRHHEQWHNGMSHYCHSLLP